jgi:hypothetical protein
MLFGRAFEQALGAYFRREDPGAILFQEWSACKDQSLQFSNRDTWDRMLEQGIMLLTRFCQDDRVQIHQPRRNQQVKFSRPIEETNSSPMLTRSGNWTGRAVCSNGRPPQAATPRSQRGCWLSTRSWSAIRG